MPTEREVLHKIINDHPEGIPELFERHGALFLNGLQRFFPGREEEYPELLRKMIYCMVKNLKEGHFDDVVETFYDWVVRDAWASFMTFRQEEAGKEQKAGGQEKADGQEKAGGQEKADGEHIDPEKVFLSADRLSEAEFSDETRRSIRDHLNACPLCTKLLEQCREIPVEVRHAGAPYPESFENVVKNTLEKL